MKYNLFILCFLTLQACTFNQKREHPIPSCIIENHLEKQYKQTLCMIKAVNEKYYPDLFGKDVRTNKLILMDSLELYMYNMTPCTGGVVVKKDTFLTINIFYKQLDGNGAKMSANCIYGVCFDKKTKLPQYYLSGGKASAMPLEADITKACECK